MEKLTQDVHAESLVFHDVHDEEFNGFLILYEFC